jgi:hypothetical protein
MTRLGTLEDNIKAEFKAAMCRRANWIHLVQNRDQWGSRYEFLEQMSHGKFPTKRCAPLTTRIGTEFMAQAENAE